MEGSQTSIQALIIANKALTTLGYVTYPLLLVLLWFFAPQLLARCIAVPAAGFVIVSVFRYVYNAPRPYEVTGIPPLVHKTTKGKSFPSRHTFCMFMIAVTWLVWQPVVGAILLICSTIMAYTRVRLRVHFTKDVIAGAVAAILFGIVGYIIIPW